VNRNLRLLGIGAALRSLGYALFFPFLALYLRNVLGIGYVEIGLLYVVVGGLQLPFAALAGLLADRVGRRRLIRISLLGESSGVIALGFFVVTGSFVGVVAAALVGGIFGTMQGPAASAYTADFAEGSERTRGFTWQRVGFNAGFAAGVSMGGFVVSLAGFGRAVEVGAVLLTIGSAFLAVVLEPSPRDAALRSAIAPPGSVPGVGDGLPVAITDRTRSSFRASLNSLGRDRVFLEVTVALSLASVVAGQWAVTLPLFVHNVLGVSYAWLGAGLALNGLVVVLGQTLTTEGVIGRRHTGVAILGTLLYVVAFLGLAIAGQWHLLPVLAFFVAVFVLTVGENLLAIPTTTLPSNMAPPDEVGNYNGASQTMLGGAYLLAIFLGGIALATITTPFAFWFVLVLPAIPSVLLLRHAARRMSPAVDRA
jgi:MFS family permease